ncbi:ketohydroxyglutarate aldolase [Acidocella aquatica]|uniref:2-dehydro-3-deoxy-phosphogluconate aldolase n=1 Tax=Acidocella aquatica TaxID=1922313 RepID=A0ABQ6A0I2_9PROT|nr:bifunctional 4-hydroxy-2-oxoglutarate aldolase/2-dehydro-3-deoxy-phosphogluconate aldolase [Acidocella aquatica]GLR65946.1 ketohydroxyglutarate aldolase [Acidocella aquatica]
MNLETILRAAPVIPVVIIDHLSQAVPLARALVAGGLPVIEITLRTAVGLEAIRAIAAEVPDAIVGAGTVLSGAQFEKTVTAGAKFAVSPGATEALLDAVAGAQVKLLPGIATASEAMRLIERGYEFAKLFPAEASGGAAFLSSIASPLPQLKFCPTGGITPDSAPRYLKLPNVICIGGSWMVNRAMIAAGDWSGITAAAAQAAALNIHRRSAAHG